MAEYSKGEETPGGAARSPRAGLTVALAGGALLGALLLVVAEFTTLYTASSANSPVPIASQGTGAHHAYALVPVALFAGVLAAALTRVRPRLPLAALGVLGLLALAVALAGDLPDAQASGVVGSLAHGYTAATDSPTTGMYLETLGAVVLIVTAGAGLLLGAPESVIADTGIRPHRPD